MLNQAKCSLLHFLNVSLLPASLFDQGILSVPLAALFKHLSKVVPRPCLDLHLPHSQWGRCLEAAKVSQCFLLSAFGMTLAEITRVMDNKAVPSPVFRKSSFH